ncbi:MAG: tetratricopeptide repeat protein, partial [Lentisphaerae bacterium]|nr:tetratricopeptide repeat protein [Lentisphaerota bacterium]
FLRMVSHSHWQRGLCITLLLSSVCAFATDEEEKQFEIAVAKGVQRINEGKAAEALGFLDRALGLRPEDPEALYYAGLAHMTLQRYEDAETMFLNAVKQGTFPDVHLELGRLYYRLSRWEGAKEHLSTFARESPDDARTREIETTVRACRAATSGLHPFLHVSLGYERDSNVILEPEAPATEGEHDSDVRAVIYASGGMKSPERRRYSFELAYGLYQSLHRELGDFDMRHHDIGPDLSVDMTERLAANLAYSFNYASFGREPYSREHVVSTGLKLMGKTAHRTEATCEYHDRRYENSPLFETNAERTGSGTSFGLSHNMRWRKWTWEGYGFFGADNATEAYWGSQGYRLGVEVHYRAHPSIFVRLSGSYDRRDYEEAFPSYDEAREDNRWTAGASLSWSLDRSTQLAVVNRYEASNSNLDIFTYNRNTVGMFMTLSFQ